VKQQLNDLEKRIKEIGYQCKLPFCDEARLAENHGSYKAAKEFETEGELSIALTDREQLREALRDEEESNGKDSVVL